ncbi:MAG: hypothetical protein B6D55_06070 [Candidatus Omnitrophica bacterium 4484_70.2]|nr:MAG: hypothetical protein B6D55_06070 [Candidatus Omnitrophica bacterium 4484_70.2]
MFLGIIIYLMSVLLNFSPFYVEDAKLDILYAKAYQVSELLMKHPGHPYNWTFNNFNRVGLVSQPNILNLSKVDELRKICNSNNVTVNNWLLDSFGLQDNGLSVEITYLNGTSILNCFPGGESLDTKASIKRIGVLNGLLVEVRVYVS